MTLEQYIRDKIHKNDLGPIQITTDLVREWIDLYNIEMASTPPHREQLTIQDNPVLTGLPSAKTPLPPEFVISGPTPHKCPICGGCGMVVGGFYTSIKNIGGTSAHTTEPCKACKEGVIWK